MQQLQPLFAAPQLDRVTQEYRSVFEPMIQQGPVYRDPELDAWVATGFHECAEILHDDDTFTRDDRFLPGGIEFWGGGRGLTIIAGIEHQKFHSMQTRELRQAYVASIRDTIIKPIMTREASQLISKGRGDLGVDYINQTPLLVGLAYLGFDIQDQEWVDAVSKAAKVRDLWKVRLLDEGASLSDPTVGPGRQAIRDLTRLFLPTIRARMAAPRDDILSQLWRDGPRVFEDWSEQDVLSACWSMFIGGQTRYLIRNAFYAAISAPSVLAGLRRDKSLVAHFVETSLRCLSPVAMIPRRVMVATEFRGMKMSAGDKIRVMLGAANSDPARWGIAGGKFELGDDDKPGHLAFGWGPRYCVGQYVARIQAIVAISTLLDMTKVLVLDRDAEPPAWHGVHPRSVKPLNVMLS